MTRQSRPQGPGARGRPGKGQELNQRCEQPNEGPRPHREPYEDWARRGSLRCLNIQDQANGHVSATQPLASRDVPRRFARLTWSQKDSTPPAAPGAEISALSGNLQGLTTVTPVSCVLGFSAPRASGGLHVAFSGKSRGDRAMRRGFAGSACRRSPRCPGARPCWRRSAASPGNCRSLLGSHIGFPCWMPMLVPMLDAHVHLSRQV